MTAKKSDRTNQRQAQQTRTMTDAQRRAAVKRSEEVGAKQAAAEIGVAEQTVYAWRSKFGGGPMPSQQPGESQVRYNDDMRDRALAMLKIEGRTRSAVARQLGLGESTVRRWEMGAKASNGHAPAAPHDESPQAFLESYEGPQGRVEAVRARYDLSIEEAALVVRRIDGREPAPPIQLQLDAPAMQAMSEIERELHALRRENRALRVLVQTYLPRVDV